MTYIQTDFFVISFFLSATERVAIQRIGRFPRVPRQRIVDATLCQQNDGRKLGSRLLPIFMVIAGRFVHEPEKDESRVVEISWDE
jgi:hypothetical protein